MEMRIAMKKRHVLYLLMLILVQTLILSASEKEINYTIDDIIEDEIIVLFESTTTSDEITVALEVVKKQIPMEVMSRIDNYVRVILEDESYSKDAIKAFKTMECVDIVENNCEISSLAISNDEYSDAQWSLQNDGRYTYYTSEGYIEKKSTERIDINAAEAWDIYHENIKEKQEVVVAVIDTGIDYQHPDLYESIWVNKGEIVGDGIDNDGNGYVDDIFGWDFYNKDNTVCHYNTETNDFTADPNDIDDHGTHIAGIIAAKANNEIGIAGIASCADVKVMVLKINGGKKATGSVADAIEAIKYATANGASVCNISWGISKYREAFERVISESNMLFVCAAGNSGTDNDKYPVYPASFKCENIISVTYVNSNGKLLRLSNYGKDSVDVAAPGEEIYSTIVGSYGIMSGTSMAAPHVTAIAAMLYSTKSNIYPSDVKELLCRNIESYAWFVDKINFPGIVNAAYAVSTSHELKQDLTLPELNLSSTFIKDKINISVNAKDEGGSGLRVLKWIIGKKGKAKFHNGTVGTSVANNEVIVSKAGFYTFYISDYAGNDFTYIYEVPNDKTAPKISASFTVANNYKSIDVSVNVTDTESGIMQIKYLKGTHSSSAFLAEGSGTPVTHKNGKGAFRITEEGDYTIYAVDYRGNKSTYIISVEIIKATDIRVFPSTIKTLYINEKYTIRPFITPSNSTDRVTYISSNPKVASISAKGVVTAKSEGDVVITVKTSSGKKAYINLSVKAKP